MNAMVEALEMAGAKDIENAKEYQPGMKLPGAIWHIWEAKYANDIRKILINEDTPNGWSKDDIDDTIHDQNRYIDKKLRMKLAKAGIVCHTIVQERHIKC